MQRFGEINVKSVSVPEGSLDDGPIGNSTVSRYGEEVQIPIQVVFDPLDLPNNVSVLAILGCGNVRRFLGILL